MTSPHILGSNLYLLSTLEQIDQSKYSSSQIHTYNNISF